MKMTVQHYNVRSSNEVDSLIEDRILYFEPKLRIEEANIRLECRFQESPAFLVRIHLVTPGPDIVAEGRDHTIRAAILKVIDSIEATIANRFGKRRRRLRSNLQEPPVSRAGLGHR